MAHDYDSELAEKFERTAEGFWVKGLSLADARKAAVEAMVESTPDQRDRLDPNRQLPA